MVSVLRGELPPEEEEVRGLEAAAAHACLPPVPSTPDYTHTQTQGSRPTDWHSRTGTAHALVWDRVSRWPV